MKIRLDARKDLWEAGEDNNDDAVDQFEAAYREAAEREAEDRGIDIQVVTPDDADYFSVGEKKEERKIWQSIHDRLNIINGEWM